MYKPVTDAPIIEKLGDIRLHSDIDSFVESLHPHQIRLYAALAVAMARAQEGHSAAGVRNTFENLATILKIPPNTIFSEMRAMQNQFVRYADTERGMTTIAALLNIIELELDENGIPVTVVFRTPLFDIVEEGE